MSPKKLPETIAKRTLLGMELLAQTDAYGVEVGMLAAGTRYTVLVAIHDPESSVSTTRLTACLRDWSRWMQTLGIDDRVAGASLSVQTREDGSSSAIAGLSFTARPRPGVDRKPLQRTQMIEEISTHLARVLDGLRESAAGLLVTVCTAQDIVDLVRIAFDSSIAADVETARGSGGTGLEWRDAPPRYEATAAAFYAHDRAVSTSWAMATRTDEELPPLDFDTALVPTPGVLSKRVTLIYRIGPELEATLTPFGLVVTADVGGVDGVSLAQELPARQLLRTRLRLRAATSAQDTTFLAGLPLDLATPHMVMLPRELKETA